MHRMRAWDWKDDRESVSIGATVRLYGHAVPVTITDISQHGCKVWCLYALPIGEVVQLELPACQPQAADVRSSLSGRAALRFI